MYVVKAYMALAADRGQLTKLKNPTMHLFQILQCIVQNRNVHVSVLNVLWDTKRVNIECLPLIYTVKVFSHHCVCRCPGGRLNKKDGLTRYGDSHVKDKTS